MKKLHLKLLRKEKTNTYTTGILYNMNTGKFLCDVLEDKVRDLNADGDLEDIGEGKVFGQTAIPYGSYPIKVTWSPKFKRNMVLIMNVKHFTGIRMHWGRSAKNSQGCPLVGEKVKDGELKNIGMTNYLVDLLLKHGNQGIIEIV